jgi:hypothetical protein
LRKITDCLTFMKPTESEAQLRAAVCQYIALQYPNAIFFHDLSGERMPIGLAVKLKKLKSSRAIPDLHILEPRHGFCGLQIELKREGERLIKSNGEPATEHIAEQFYMLQALRDRGYLTFMVSGFVPVKRILNLYFSDETKENFDYIKNTSASLILM